MKNLNLYKLFIIWIKYLTLKVLFIIVNIVINDKKNLLNNIYFILIISIFKRKYIN